jgi:hypothetical protein
VFGRDQDSGKALRIAVAAMTASLGLGAERSTLYFDLVVASLSEAARMSLQAMDPAKYEYQSEFAKRFIAQGKAEGERSGRAAVLIKQLALKYGPLAAAASERVQHANAEELVRWAERVLSADSIDDVLR